MERFLELFLSLDKRFTFRFWSPHGEDGKRLLGVSKWTRSREYIELRIWSRFGRESDGLRLRLASWLCESLRRFEVVSRLRSSVRCNKRSHLRGVCRCCVAGWRITMLRRREEEKKQAGRCWQSDGPQQPVSPWPSCGSSGDASQNALFQTGVRSRVCVGGEGRLEQKVEFVAIAHSESPDFEISAGE